MYKDFANQHVILLRLKDDNKDEQNDDERDDNERRSVILCSLGHL